MTEEQLAKFKLMFELQKKNILLRQKLIDDQLQVPLEELSDDSDRTSVDLQQALRIRMRHREAAYFKKIELALKRIAGGSFGSCDACEQPIEVKRLQARPTTTFCLSCKEAQEAKERLQVKVARHGGQPHSLEQVG